MKTVTLNIELILNEIEEEDKDVYEAAMVLLDSFEASLGIVCDAKGYWLAAGDITGLPDWFEEQEDEDEPEKVEESGCSRKELEELSKPDPKTNYDW